MTCDLFEKIQEKENRGKIQMNKSVQLFKKSWPFFHYTFYTPTIEKLSFHIAHVIILGSLECGNTKCD